MAGVAGVEGVYVVVSDKGDVFFVDGTQGGHVHATTLKGKAPFSVACTYSTAPGETCVISDADGNAWHGPCRAGLGDFKPA
jgi:hypothetical protein